MTKNKKALLAVSLAAALASPMLALAQAGDRGGYLGLTAGRVDYKDFCDQLTGVACDNSDTAWRFFGGYQFSRNGALEIGYANLGAASASSGAASARYEVYAWDVSGRLSFPVSPQFSLFGKLGLYHADVEVRGNIGPFTATANEKNSGITYGAGAQWFFTRSLAARLEYQVYSGVGDSSTTGEDDLGAFTAGIVWKFQ